jgi:lipoprotein-releasing system ATP-binding protein
MELSASAMSNARDGGGSPSGAVWIPSRHEAGDMSPVTGDPHLYLKAENLTKRYVLGGRELRLFDGLSFSAYEGELIAIVGQSGAGKSTLLHLLGALDAPTSGEVHCGSAALGALSASEAARFRNREVGYVWQFHYLLPEFTAAENVAMPLLARGMKKREALAKAGSWLERVDLGDRLNHRAGELSGGEQQRVSIARALVTEPRLLLADEPTGDLDSATADGVFALIESLHRTQGLTTVLVTHNMALARRAARVLRLISGKLEEVPPESV